MNAQQNPQRPDALVQLYREASAQDAGPSTASTAQILAHARAQAAQALPADAQSLITTTHLDWLHNTPCPLPAFQLENSTLRPVQS